MARFEVHCTMKLLILLRAAFLLSFIQEDGIFGTQEVLLSLMNATNTCIAMGFVQLSLQRSLPRQLLYGEHAPPTLSDIRAGMCKELFHFTAPDIVIMCQALGWHGQCFRIPTGHDNCMNWYVADGETIMLVLLY
jgi:hypothetical protein